MSLTSDRFNEWIDCKTNGHMWEWCGCHDGCDLRYCLECDEVEDTQEV